jgi:DNA polymerase (family 10)
VVLSNTEIADRLASLAQLLSVQKENPYKIRAYKRAAARIRGLPESLDEMVRNGDDLTQYAGIGEAIASAIREIVQTGALEKLDKLRAEAAPAINSLSHYPRLDPKQVLRVYKKLGIASIEELRERLETGAIEQLFGSRMAQHILQGLTETQAILLYKADDLRATVQDYLLKRCGARRAEPAGDYRRRVEVIDELVFVIETDDFPAVVAQLERYGGRTPLVSSSDDQAVFGLSSGVLLRIEWATPNQWGWRMIECTGSQAHLKNLDAVIGQRATNAFSSEEAFYGEFRLRYIEPELREGHDEIERAANGTLPRLVTLQDIRGDLHAHTTSSDGMHSVEEMAEAVKALGYEYLGITDHSRSLTIARGLPIENLRAQMRVIDELNGRLRGIRILKSAEVDILEDGSLDYPDEVLEELDYTVCSIHSRFALGKQEQTERILRAMDNRYFHILGHATGRMLLRRPGYEIDIDRVVDHARQNGCFFEINANQSAWTFPPGTHDSPRTPE